MGGTIDYRRLVQRVRRSELAMDTYDWGVLGGQHEWVWAVAMPYRTLAAPYSGAAMPESPRRLVVTDKFGAQEGDFTHGLGYFASLQSFLTYSFGWTRHDKGLLWWFDQGFPVADERFALIRDIWLYDGLLERYLAWSVSHHDVLPLKRFAVRADRDPVVLTPHWRERLRNVEAEAARDDLSTNPDGKHLEHGEHIGEPSMLNDGTGLQPVVPGRLVAVDLKSRSAVYIGEQVRGWYASLADLGSQLPPLPNGRSWRIEVHVKPIGYLGRYRRSRDTGLWFSGRHAHHVVGN